eukprot:Hpha_TRINITY_DN8960_c0_g1::TRINITY_DN8960_c0_g1_i1::g.81020::m.81020
MIEDEPLMHSHYELSRLKQGHRRRLRSSPSSSPTLPARRPARRALQPPFVYDAPEFNYNGSPGRAGSGRRADMSPARSGAHPLVTTAAPSSPPRAGSPLRHGGSGPIFRWEQAPVHGSSEGWPQHQPPPAPGHTPPRATNSPSRQGEPQPPVQPRPVPPLTSPASSPPRPHSSPPRAQFQELPPGRQTGPPSPFDLNGVWVARPGGVEAMDVAHDRVSGKLEGLVLRAAPWSDCHEGETVAGFVDPFVGRVELYKNKKLVLALFAHPANDSGLGDVILVPSPEAEGNIGHWQVVRHAGTSVTDLPVWTDTTGTDPLLDALIDYSDPPPSEFPTINIYT